jgi:hypothetical protein
LGDVKLLIEAEHDAGFLEALAAKKKQTDGLRHRFSSRLVPGAACRSTFSELGAASRTGKTMSAKQKAQPSKTSVVR